MGRDSIAFRLRWKYTSFNPRARVGRDLYRGAIVDADTVFQSTRPRGARQFHSGMVLGWTGFNPRARVGRDATVARLPALIHCFNPRARVGRDCGSHCVE